MAKFSILFLIARKARMRYSVIEAVGELVIFNDLLILITLSVSYSLTFTQAN